MHFKLKPEGNFFTKTNTKNIQYLKTLFSYGNLTCQLDLKFD